MGVFVVPPRLYKFIERQYGQRLLQRGELRITTLYRCRQIEAAGPGRGDPSENTKHSLHYVHGSHLRPDTHPAPWALVNQTFGQGAAGSVYVSQSMFDLRYNGPDMYLYCTTSFPRRGLEKRWRSDSGDDVWIEIFKPAAFCQALSQATRHLGQCLGVHQVHYGPRTTFRGVFPAFGVSSQHIHAAILKTPVFEIEREWRQLWAPATLPIERVDVVAPELSRYCRLLRAVKSLPRAA